tara:strand:- start:147 stop:1322 length:1176 start_codon:yes stop_codon:yes gene_type:complete
MKIAVIGTGTVGVMTVCHFLHYSANMNLKIDCIHNPEKDILGIGESTNIQIPDLLFRAANYNGFEDAHELDLTIKHGVMYKNWRKKDFLSPITPPSYAFHFNNFKLKDVIFKRLKKYHKNNFEEIKGNVSSVKQNNREVTLTVNKKKLKYDYVIDCSGYPEDYSDYTMPDFLPINHCLVHSIKEPGNWNYTYHQATKNGWMFGIPLKTRQGWGYLFNDKITKTKEAEEDISKIFNTKKLNLREFKFKAYRANNVLNNRVIKNGNKAIFYEPMEALSSVVYDNLNRMFYDYILNKLTEEEVNIEFNTMAKQYENFICFVYHGGSIFNTPFWKDTVARTTKHLKNNESWNRTIEYINDPTTFDMYLGTKTQSFPFIPRNYRIIQKGLNYEYFR